MFRDFFKLLTWLTLESERLLMYEQEAALSCPGVNPGSSDLY